MKYLLVLFVVLVAWGLYRLLTRKKGGGQPSGPRPGTRSVKAERLAELRGWYEKAKRIAGRYESNRDVAKYGPTPPFERMDFVEHPRTAMIHPHYTEPRRGFGELHFNASDPVTGEDGLTEELFLHEIAGHAFSDYPALDTTGNYTHHHDVYGDPEMDVDVGGA